MENRSAGVRGLVAELHRRRVFRVIVVYAAACWLLIQVADTVVPALRLPEWIITATVLLSLAGFPVAIALAWAFDITRYGIRRTDDAVARARVPAARRFAAVGAVAAVAALSGWAGWQFWRSADTPPADPDIVAVLPFRYSGDPSLAYLGEAMVDLLAAKLTGETGPRAVDPRALMRAWRAAGSEDVSGAGPALALARSLGAGRVLTGEVVGAPSARLAITTTLLGGADGEAPRRVVVEGPADSVLALVDDLAVRFLLLEAGEQQHRLENLTTTSLSALEAYLKGQALHRRARFEEALDHYVRALELDSTFALAALAAHNSAQWGVIRPGLQERALELAWASRDRLSPRDRLHLEAISGPDYPDPSTAVAMLRAAEQAVDATPDRAELWFNFADVLFHVGPRLGHSDWRERATAAFRRSLDLGMEQDEPVWHLLDLLVDAGDSAAVRRIAAEYLPPGDGTDTDYGYWLVGALATGRDSAAVAAVIGGLSPHRARLILRGSEEHAIGLAVDAGLALAQLRSAVVSPSERAVNLRAEINYLMSRGRIDEAQTAFEELATLAPTVADRWRIYNALYWGGPEDAAASAAVRITARTADGRASLADLCVSAQWQLARDMEPALEPLIQRLATETSPNDVSDTRVARICAAMLRAHIAMSRGTTNGGPAIEAFTRTIEQYLPYFHWDPFLDAAALVLARMREAQGDIAGALAASRRRTFGAGTPDFFLSEFLREEGRLAALAGEHDAAVRAYRRFLALQSDADPARATVVEGVRAELARLTGER